MAKKPERKVIVTYSDKPMPEMLPTYFVEFIQEMGRVIEARKERERKAQEVNQ